MLPEQTARLSHACIVSALSRQEALSRASDIARRALCTGVNPPCGVCRNCRKIHEGIHPDVITVSRPVDDKGREKREITVDQIRTVSADASVLPNEASRKIYIIDQADTMNISAQNAALKLLEEPPNGAMFLLCVTNPQQLLPTVRSRCSELSVTGQSDRADEAVIKLSQSYLRAVESRDAAKLLQFCVANEGMDSRTAPDFFLCCDSLIADCICQRRSSSLSRRELMELHELMERCIRYLKVNTGVKHIFGLLAVKSLPAEKTEDR